MTRSRAASYWTAFAVIVGMAAILRFWALDMGLPHLMTRPDEEVILVETRAPATGTFDLKYGIYPSAYIFLSWGWGELGHAALKAAGLNKPVSYAQAIDEIPWRILLVLRALSAFAGVAAVALLMVIVRRELGSAAALIAGAVLAVCLIHVRDSHAAKPDVLMSLGVVASLGMMAPLGRTPSMVRAAATGVLIGLTMGMKYPTVLLLVPTYVLCVMSSARPGWRRLLPGTAVVAALAAALAFVVTSPDLLFNPETRNRVLSIVVLVFPKAFPGVVTEAPRIPAASLRFQHPQSALEGWSFYSLFALRYGAGLAFLCVLPFAMVWAFLSKQSLTIAAAIFGATAFLLFGTSPALLSRYMTPVMPAFAIVVASASSAAVRRAVPRRADVVFALLTAVLIAEPLWRSVQHDHIAAETDTRVLAANWLRENAPPGSKVAIAGTVFWSWGEPWVPPPLELVRTGIDPASLEAAGVRYLVTHDHVLFSSHLDPEVMARLAPHLRLRAEFEPFCGPREKARYDLQDAYYIPMAGFGVVTRPGPSVRIYELE
jgi:4-amino-4-deoxy-L-arabinose transferase-like glycosyltransferase